MDIDLQALRIVEKEKNIPLDTLVETIETALLKAYANASGAIRGARVEVNRKTGKVCVIAPEYDENGERIGEFDDTPSGFGRIATATARQIIMGRLREAEDAQLLGEFAGKEGKIVSGVVQKSKDPRVIVVKVGDMEAIIPEREQVPGEHYKHGDWIRAYVVKAGRTPMGRVVVELSRTHPGLVRELFAREVPEIGDKIVDIVSVAREAGYRSKIAVRSRRPEVNARNACVGTRGMRVRAVMNEVNGEKIDIIEYSSDPAQFVANALSPATVSSVTVVGNNPIVVRAVVPDYQLRLAIGKEGQNSRLAARLTGTRIEIVGDNELEEGEEN